MPRLEDHGIGGTGGKALGVPLYPLDMFDGYVQNDGGTLRVLEGSSIATIPETSYSNAGCTIGDLIYLIGMKSNENACYKYNVKTREWTKLTDSPYEGLKIWAVSHGSDIYYGCAGSTSIYKYDTISDTHSLLLSATGHVMDYSRATIDGDNIYIFGGNSSATYQTYATRVDIANETYTRLKTIPIGMYNHSVVSGGDGYIYLFGGQVNSTIAYKYSIADNVYSAISDIPVSFYGTMIVRIDNYIYLINSAQSLSKQMIYAYDILTDTYTSLGSTLKARQYGNAGVVDGVIYMIGGGTGSTTYSSGDTIMPIKGEVNTFTSRRLPQGVKVYTDGDVCSGSYIDFDGNKVFKVNTTLGKINDVVTTPVDGDYAMIGSSYATMEG